MHRAKQFLKRIGGKFLIVPPILVGAAILVVAIAMRQTPEQNPPSEIARPLSVMPVSVETVRPTVIGYGLARPARIWTAVARVSGNIVSVHPRLKAGEIIDEGSQLIKIDPTDYELAIQQLEANHQNAQAKLDELQRSRENDVETLEVETESLSLAENEVSRIRKLLPQNAASQSEFDRVKREWLQQRRAVQSLKNSLNLVPAKAKQLEAEIRTIEKQLQAAKRDLERTTIVAPFDCRLAVVNIEPGQFVATNESLFEVHGTAAIEVEAQIPIDDVQRLVDHQSIPSAPEFHSDQSMSDDFHGATASRSGSSLNQVLDGLDAKVFVRSGDFATSFSAVVTRVRERIERRTRTIGMVVTIDRENSDPASSILLEGAFCEVVFEGRPQQEQMLVPLASVNADSLFVVDKNNRLKRLSADVKFSLGDRVVVSGELFEGDRVVVSNPTPAVEGMLVDPIVRQSENSSLDQLVDSRSGTHHDANPIRNDVARLKEPDQ